MHTLHSYFYLTRNIEHTISHTTPKKCHHIKFKISVLITNMHLPDGRDLSSVAHTAANSKWLLEREDKGFPPKRVVPEISSV